ncbi:hypothetical protein TIFTF001_011220 [Ficus carica]|uniref:Protein root UVB sensitive 3 n=1 Tax=Ficus carica TaxID=3494 RepID=A0AA87ZZS2_FICCA|nr:hypothetical protein TIFTF001_011220 [Ficus carica]
MEAPSPPPPTSIVVEEWNGSFSTKLSKTATITASPSISVLRSLNFSSFCSLSLLLYLTSLSKSVDPPTISTTFGGGFSKRLYPRQVVLSTSNFYGFPSSVTPDYVPFQVWDSLQGLSTYIRTMLSTQALLSAIGVGEKSATVIGATFQGSNLDSNAKMWRLVADLMNDLGLKMTKEFSPYIGGRNVDGPYFTSISFRIRVCSLLRESFKIIHGATRAALTQHFALQNNAADISAKEGSQETLATMSGMALGMLLARITMGNPFAIWFSFLALTMFHMYANYKAVQCLSLTTLNPQRCSILLQHFIETGQVPSPEQVSKMEHILPVWTSSWSSKNSRLIHTRVRLGVRVSSLSHPELTDLLRYAGSHYRKAKYLLLERNGIFSIIMHKDSTAVNILQAFVHAHVMATLTDKNSSVHTESQSWMDGKYEVFLQKNVFWRPQSVGKQIGAMGRRMRSLTRYSDTAEKGWNMEVFALITRSAFCNRAIH